MLRVGFRPRKSNLAGYLIARDDQFREPGYSPGIPTGRIAVIRSEYGRTATREYMDTDKDSEPAAIAALRPYIELEHQKVELRVPITMPAGRVIRDLSTVFMRFPRWEGPAFVDDFGKKATGLIELNGEHLFAELAVLRLLEHAGWSGRWVNTYSGRGEVWKYLTEWKDLPRAEQRSRPIEEAEPRQLLAAIAGLNKPARYKGCWDVFAWKGSDVAFLQCKRTTPKYKDVVSKEQEDWVRSALYLGNRRVSVESFCFVQWDYQ
jgi:hypothetical protein